MSYAKENPAIKSIALNIHTPFPGTEELTLSLEERHQVIDEVIQLKREGFPCGWVRSGEAFGRAFW